jgi:para-aminobenzoate synthetase component 2
MILIVDNYDSFVHNVARYFEELGERVLIRRNDEVDDRDLKAKAIVISPGPCAPRQAGQSMDIVRKLSGQIPILGICLGHQVIGEVFGDLVTRARKPMHGDSSDILHDGTGVFAGCRNASVPDAITRSLWSRVKARPSSSPPAARKAR